MNKKWYSKKHRATDVAMDAAPVATNTNITDQHYFTQFKNDESFKNLSHRIDGLEKQNDQLLQYINLLVENLPELIRNVIQLHEEQRAEAFLESEEACTDPRCCSDKADPCPTRREQDVLDLLVKGFCAKEIALRLFISETTVITHKKNLKEKFNAKNTVELISKVRSHVSRAER